MIHKKGNRRKAVLFLLGILQNKFTCDIISTMEVYIMICPNCGSQNVDVQTFQENQGSVTKRKFKIKETGHGCLWWLIIGWWWLPIKIMLWVLYFPAMLILSLIKRILSKKKYKGTSDEVTVNRIAYTTICVCKDCGHRWEV